MAKLFRITTVPLSIEKLLGKQLPFMAQHFDLTAISADQNELARVGRELGIKTHAIDMTRKITPLQDLKSLWMMYRYLKNEKPEIVHTHTPKAGLIGMLAARMASVPHRFHTVAGLPLMETQGVKRKVLDLVEKLTYAAATKVYPNSKGLYDFIIKNNYTASAKLKVIGNGSSNGIDTSYFAPDQISESQLTELKNNLGIQNDDFVFIFVGRLVGDKGINEMVKAFSQIKNKKAKLLLVGDKEDDLDPLHPDIIKEIETNPNILAVGFQKDVRPYFAISQLLVFPSYREGFPNVVMQAGAMGLPAIVSNINGCNEIIVQDINGRIIPAKDSISLLFAMQDLLDNHDVYQMLKQNSRRMITERYEQSVVWEQLLAEYRRIMKEKP